MKRVFLGLCIGALLGFPFLAYTLSSSEKIITVSVSVDKSLAQSAEPNWPLYVYAARPNTRLPLSTFKGKFSDLPLTLTLDETMYLLPELTLKDATEVVVVAKVSKNLDPHKKTNNDLIGFSSVLSFSNGNQQAIDLKIDQKDKPPADQ